MDVKKVALVTPEYYGQAMVGGLAPAVYGLAKALKKAGIEPRVFMPSYYPTSDGQRLSKTPSTTPSFEFHQTNQEDIKIYHLTGLDVGMPYSYRSTSAYIEDFGLYREQIERMYDTACLFSLAAVMALEQIANKENWSPDLVHLHEWQSASASYYLRQNKVLSNIPTVVTTHNAKYVGRIPYCPRLLGENYILNYNNPLEDNKHRNAISIGEQAFLSLLEFGIFFADAVNTVSPAYREELLGGKQKDVDKAVIKRMKEKGLVGILNGLDNELFNPKKDPFIDIFDPSDPELVAYAKGINKLRLYQTFQIEPLPVGTMQISMLSRLAEQKGIDLVLEAANEIGKMDGIELFIIGEPDDPQLIGEIRGKGGRVFGHPEFADPKKQHLVLAGSDAILMPSRYEPCGYTQMEGMRYGAVPIVTPVGGLKDTVTQFDGSSGTGFIIKEASASAIVEAIKEAHQLFQTKEKWRKVQANGLAEDFSWEGHNGSIGKYIELYQSAIKARAPKKEEQEKKS